MAYSDMIDVKEYVLITILRSCIYKGTFTAQELSIRVLCYRPYIYIIKL